MAAHGTPTGRQDGTGDGRLAGDRPGHRPALRRGRGLGDGLVPQRRGARGVGRRDPRPGWATGRARWPGRWPTPATPSRPRPAWPPRSTCSAAVDILVNNAATNPYYGPIIDIDQGRADKTVRVNQSGYLEWTQAAWRAGMSDARRRRAQHRLHRRADRRGGHRLVQRDQGGRHPPDQPAGRRARPRGPGQRHRPRPGQDPAGPGPVGAGRGDDLRRLPTAAPRRARRTSPTPRSSCARTPPRGSPGETLVVDGGCPVHRQRRPSS